MTTSMLNAKLLLPTAPSAAVVVVRVVVVVGNAP
ncbi:ilvB operon leader peptide IvbL [Shigella flexneri]